MEIFKTSSVPASAFLMANGYPLPQLQAFTPDRFQFCFEDPRGEAKQLLESYFRGGAVASRDFFSALCAIRGAITRAKMGGAQ